MTYNCRCTKRRTCGKRVTLAMHPNSYVVYPKCPQARCDGLLNYEPNTKLATQRRTCRCRGIHFPHKTGLFLSINEFCHHAEVDLTFGTPITTMRPQDDCPF